ncbi:acidic leucine-rich nuclear phosphoprotein 32 family member A isoform X2 [Ischnura elegans]|uniref:acidic leucine-rich nuclear phosphoprotein 32 family member A isoform X2 n=1 Tax=Ischnura elegans TaxID=197161 RepID=UPI001ED87443|nr:acidic leucine-rich nuclear phosphoprotein 32 family member A isoform X2 [Ischnura elegans]
MEKRIELERRGQPPGSVLELNLDNCRSTSIVGLTDEFSNLRTLSLINVGLISLRGFPALPNLTKIELSDNRISGGLYHLHGSPKLIYINLGGNRISDFEALEPLQEFKHLKCLDLFANKLECYKEKVFELLPSLTYLDGLDRDDKEMTTDEEEVNGNDEDSDSENSSSSSFDEDDSDGDSPVKNDEYDLGKVYDPDLKDDTDNEDYYAEEGVEDEDDEDDDIDDYEEEEYGNANEEQEEQAAAPAAAPASEEGGTPRGKKRKHDDAEEGQDV